MARLIPEGGPRRDDVRWSVEGLRELQQQIRRRSKVALTARQVHAAIRDAGRERIGPLWLRQRMF